jgi:outer membrane protein OmpA-like peptidoglycan-associated protein
MRKAIIFCLLVFALASAQVKQRVAVLPSVGEAGTLDDRGLNFLTDKVREIASKILPTGNFMLLRQEAVINAIGGEEDFFRECKEGTCVGELAKKANADYGARCDVFKMDKDLILKFELYSVKDEAILETFTDYNVKDFREMITLLEERLPNAFRKMLPQQQKPIVESVYALPPQSVTSSSVTVEPSQKIFPQNKIENKTNLEGVNFLSGKAELTDNAKRVLDNVAKQLLASPAKIEIHCHTDDQGRASANKELSQRRAEAVVSYLASKGVNASYMHAIGFGRDMPIASNKTAEGRAKNRRVELIIKD